VGCREQLPKRTLVRLVRSPDGVRIDPTGKAAGRGAYLHNRRSCWERALKGGALEQALRSALTETERQTLWQVGQAMPTGDDGEGNLP
jgi:predicted RNA-binding protein YlxR (DUF448 family)